MVSRWGMKRGITRLQATDCLELKKKGKDLKLQVTLAKRISTRCKDLLVIKCTKRIKNAAWHKDYF